MRRIVATLVIALVATACRGVGDATPDPYGSTTAHPFTVVETPSPFDAIAAGPVQGIIPDAWQPIAPHIHGAVHQGFSASPRPRAWQRMDGSVAGMAATWVDVSNVGVPSDFYYLAATGPALGRLVDGDGCTARTRQILVDHRPEFFAGRDGSPGDYVARGRGVCGDGASITRWAYFIAAPGFGPVRKIGIPSSGLYVVVAVLPDSTEAGDRLRRILAGARFGDASLIDLAHAASATTNPTA